MSSNLLAGDFAVVGQRVATPRGIGPAAVLVAAGRIVQVSAPDDVPTGVPITDVGDRLLLPGMVDIHVHLNEPGRTEWEGLATGTRAAAAGGVTTVVDMPLNSSPVTTTVAALSAKRAAAASAGLWADVGFHAGVIPGNIEHIRPLAEAGVLAFKAFLCPSGLEEFPAVGEAELRPTMAVLAELGLPLLVHAELVSPLPTGADAALAVDPRSYSAYLATRPPDWEVAAVELMVRLCQQTGCPVHIVHVATDEVLPILQSAVDRGLPISAETCPHYLLFAAEEIPPGRTEFKCAPPIRSAQTGRRLLSALLEEIVTVGSDHSPAPPAIKSLETGSFATAWGGISGIQFSWSAVFTALTRAGLELYEAAETAVAVLCANPAGLVGLAGRKGTIASGADADLVVFDPGVAWQPTLADLHTRHAVSPYVGQQLLGRVQRTYLRGEVVYDAQRLSAQPRGQCLRR